MGAPAIAISKVTRQYARGGEVVKALDEFDLEIPEGGYYAIMGPSGSGKSTLLNLVGGLDRPDTGQVQVAGEDLNTFSSGELAEFRANTIGFVFQGFNLLPVLTALQNVELPLLLTPLGAAARRKQALHALELVGLSDRVHHRPRQLSGGQEQRVAIARALATDPQLILADEPTGDLDRESAGSVLELLERLNKEFKKTIVMVTHDPRAADSAGHVVHLDKGKLERIVDNRGEQAKQATDSPPTDAPPTDGEG